MLKNQRRMKKCNSCARDNSALGWKIDAGGLSAKLSHFVWVATASAPRKNYRKWSTDCGKVRTPSIDQLLVTETSYQGWSSDGTYQASHTHKDPVGECCVCILATCLQHGSKATAFHVTLPAQTYMLPYREREQWMSKIYTTWFWESSERIIMNQNNTHTHSYKMQSNLINSIPFNSFFLVHLPILAWFLQTKTDLLTC